MATQPIDWEHDFKQAWLAYKRMTASYAEYLAPEELIKPASRAFFRLMAENFNLAVSDWQLTDMQPGFAEFFRGLSVEEALSVDVARLYRSLRVFLVIVIRQYQLPFDDDQLSIELSPLEWELLEPHGNEAQLPRWNQTRQDAVVQDVRKWQVGFMTSPERQRLTDVTDENVTLCLVTLAMDGYDRYRKTLRNLTGRVVEQLLTTDVLANFYIGTVDCQKMAPTWRAFFQYLKRTGLRPQAQAAALARAAERGGDQLRDQLAQAADYETAKTHYRTLIVATTYGHPDLWLAELEHVLSEDETRGTVLGADFDADRLLSPAAVARINRELAAAQTLEQEQRQATQVRHKHLFARKRQKR